MSDAQDKLAREAAEVAELTGRALDWVGDPENAELVGAEARSLTFAHRRKVFLVSTPTIRGVSRIEREYEASDQRRFFVPCPHCGEEYYDQAEVCPHCGLPREAESGGMPVWAIATTVLVLLAFVMFWVF